MMDSGIVLAVAVAAVAYFLVTGNEDFAGVLAAVDLGAMWLYRIRQ